MMSRERGLKRKCRNLARRIEEETADFPQPPVDCDYWHLHLPVARALVDSRAALFQVRRLCIMTLVRRASHLGRMAPMGRAARVVVLITLPELWDSQIVVFFGQSCFHGFFDRESDEQRWTLTTTLLSKEWNLELPPGFGERVYDEEIWEGNTVRRGQIWVVSDLEKFSVGEKGAGAIESEPGL